MPDNMFPSLGKYNKRNILTLNNLIFRFEKKEKKLKKISGKSLIPTCKVVSVKVGTHGKNLFKHRINNY